MPQRQNPRWLLERLPPRYRVEVATAIERAGVSMLTEDTVGCARRGGYLLQVGMRRVTVPDSARGAARRRKLDQFAALLGSAWAAEVRRTVIEATGGDPHAPPAWAWRCSQLLRDALAAARMGSNDLARLLANPHTAGHRVFIAIETRESIKSCQRPLALSVERPPIGARLRAHVEIVPGVEYREAGDRTYSISQTELLVTDTNLSHTITSALPLRHVTQVLDHPLLRRPEYLITGAWNVRGCSRVRFAMPERSLARLPPDIADLLGVRDRSGLDASPWR